MGGELGKIRVRVLAVKKWSNRLSRMGWLFVLLWGCSLGTAEAPPGHAIPPAIWDVKRAGDPLPTWAGPVTTQRGLQMSVWRVLIRPPAGDSKLAVTVVFREPKDGFARVIWQAPGRAVTLCGNLFEKSIKYLKQENICDKNKEEAKNYQSLKYYKYLDELKDILENWVNLLTS